MSVVRPISNLAGVLSCSPSTKRLVANVALGLLAQVAIFKIFFPLKLRSTGILTNCIPGFFRRFKKIELAGFSFGATSVLFHRLNSTNRVRPLVALGVLASLGMLIKENLNEFYKMRESRALMRTLSKKIRIPSRGSQDLIHILSLVIHNWIGTGLGGLGMRAALAAGRSF